jgi:hypothetical protein
MYIPTEKQMEDSRKQHFFRNGDDDRMVVISQMLPNGEWVAFLDENEEKQGFGNTRLEAIADLNSVLEDAAEDAR